MEALTVVIPTFNRRDILQKALEGYFTQSAPQAIRELIVVDDGSTDCTQATVEAAAARSPFEIRYFRQEKKGPAAARNLGICRAQAEVILFTDDDIIPSPNLVSEHLAWHSRNQDLSTAVLGHVTWAPEVNPTRFMAWYESDGALFGYGHLRARAEADYRYFYSCNISLKISFLHTAGMFDEDFKAAAFEDIELGYRLQKAGMRLLYNPQAIAYHLQFFSFEDACRKAKLGKPAADVFANKEAGKCFHDLGRRRQSSNGYRLAKWVADCIEPAVRPARGLLNSQFPLPAFMYRLFWYYANRPDKIEQVRGDSAKSMPNAD